MKKQINPRRDFLRRATLGLGAGILAPLQHFAAPFNAKKESSNESTDTVHVRLLQTTDVHCQIHPHDELYWEDGQAVFRRAGGYATLQNMFNQLRSETPNTLVIDTGDMFQGSQLSVKTEGDAMRTLLNACNYDLFLPGNWEVIYGKERMLSLMNGLNAPTICTNMFHDNGQQQKGNFIFKPYEVKTIGGIRIGFLGYTDPLVPIRQSPNYSKGIIYTAPEENLAEYVNILRNKENCSAVIMLAHLGLSQQIALSNHPSCEGVDYILGGDTHERVRVPIPGKYAKVVEPGAFGSFIGQLDLFFKQGKLVQSEYALLDVDPSKQPKNPNMNQLIDDVELEFEEAIYSVVGYSTIPLYRYFVIENPIDTLVLQALHAQFPETDIVLSNGFRFCPPRTTPNDDGLIPITNGFIVDMLPVDSTVRQGKVTGQQLLDWLEKELNNVFAADASKRFGGWVVKFKGMTVRFYAFKPMGQRVESVNVGNEPLNPKAIYSILACERDGDPEDMLCRMKGVQEAHNTRFTLHGVMAKYIKRNSPVTPTPEKNAIALDAPDTLLSQVTGVPYTFR